LNNRPGGGGHSYQRGGQGGGRGDQGHGVQVSAVTMANTADVDTSTITDGTRNGAKASAGGRAGVRFSGQHYNASQG
jgi:hypothetical protein